MKIKFLKFPNLFKKAPQKTTSVKLNAAISRTASRRSLLDREEEDADDTFQHAAEPNMKLSHAFVVVLVLHVIAVAGVFAFNAIKAQQKTETAGIVQDTTTQGTGTSEAAKDLEFVQSPTAPATQQVQQTNPSDASLAPSHESQMATTVAAPAATAPPQQTAAAATAPPAAMSKTATVKTHEIRSGDTLTRIASTYGVRVEALQKENGISDPSHLKIGDTLRIPANATSTGAAPHAAPAVATTNIPKKGNVAATTSVASTKPAAAAKTYTVVKGDNPVAIARKLKVKYSYLIRINHIEDPKKLQIGQKLKVP